ncbi:hypothetical protein [Zhihengliuella halotolerans]|uniref:hypothetical protein n=1 Tax=Zhihengliuella halotolerans TaxID=370736 RepID=UPI000C804A99|nr:hypothetical protein [Zhihengliuella halotolerans]
MTTPNIPDAVVKAGAVALLFEDCGDTSLWEPLGEAEKQNFMDQSRAVLAAAWEHLHPVVETVEDWDDLRTLPGGTVIQQNSGGRMVLERFHGGWFAIGVEAPYTLRQATGFLPATVLFRGGDAL